MNHILIIHKVIIFVYHIKNKISNSIKFSQIKLFLFVIHLKIEN